MTETSPRDVPEARPAAFADPATFRQEVVDSCRPAILRGVFRDWAVVRAAETSPAVVGDFLAGLATALPTQAFVGKREIGGRYYYGEGLKGFNFERQDTDLRSAIARILDSATDPHSSSIYVGSLPARTYLPDLAALNPAPMLPRNVDPRIWIGNASNVSCHHDTYDNLAAVVAGRRRFTLYPPEAVANLYVGPIDHTMAGPPVALAEGSERGDPRYPAFEAIRDQALHAELGPGDALYLPKLWWHRVEATAPFNILINYWWDAFSGGPDAPFTTLLLAMTAIAERPPPERAAWAAMFDHYVFRRQGHPLAHLPAEQHGILGPLKDNYGRLRAHVMQLLRG